MRSPEKNEAEAVQKKQCCNSGLSRRIRVWKKASTKSKTAFRILQNRQNYKVSLRVRLKPGLPCTRLSPLIAAMCAQLACSGADSGIHSRSFRLLAAALSARPEAVIFSAAARDPLVLRSATSETGFLNVWFSP
jgi:hypothetical protein